MKIAIIIPAYNEETTIVRVIEEYNRALPEAMIYVGDNNSLDETAKRAKGAGAQVIPCGIQGKGNAVRLMLKCIDADIYIITDADGTYSADNIHELLEPVKSGAADMTVGARTKASFNALSVSHKIGNFLLTMILNLIFKVKFKDILSGYRVLSRHSIENLILISEGFEIETEITIRSLQERLRILEIPVEYRCRPRGSESKLSTWGDGVLLLYTIITLFRDYNPMKFFVMISLFFLSMGIISGIYIFIQYLQTGLMIHIGLAIVTALCILLSAIIFMMGLVLDSLNNSWQLMRESMRRDRETMKDT